MMAAAWNATATGAVARNAIRGDEIVNSTGRTEAALSEILQGEIGQQSLGSSELAHQLLALYAAREFRPIWTGSVRAKKSAEEVRAALGLADRQGLKAADYKLPETPASPNPNREAAEYDIELSRALLRYAADMRTGRLQPREVYRDVELPKNAFDAVGALVQALNSGSLSDFIAGLPPPHSEYRRLVLALSHYRAIADSGGWPKVSGQNEGPVDAQDKRLQVLIRRLAFEDPALASDPNPSPADLEEAVKRFQARHGLNADGHVGQETLAELNVPASYRVQQIIANMERWRWLPAPFENRYIMVNVPEQSVYYIQNGRVVLSSRAIVGRKSSPTPILRTEIDAVVVNPPWNVPGDIAARAFLPSLRKNPNYLASHNMRIVNGPPGDPHGVKINWRSVSAREFPYQIRQMPPNSALGQLMLNSPNTFDVYLHDTPQKKAFSMDHREISNGCIRVQSIFQFASLALTGDPAAGEERLNNVIGTRETHRIALDRPLPVYMLYWTAIPDADGNVVFQQDRYQRDPKLISGLSHSRDV